MSLSCGDDAWNDVICLMVMTGSFAKNCHVYEFDHFSACVSITTTGTKMFKFTNMATFLRSETKEDLK